jgi:exosortase/archaeosortase family protein
MGRIKDFIIEFINKHRLYSLKDVALFIIITAAIHFAWKVWQNSFEYAPITQFMYDLMVLMSTEVYSESSWIISGFIEIETVEISLNMIFPEGSMMWVNSGCSGLKQMIQFALLMLIFPGPWKKKLWFIPLGIVVMHLTNIFRIVGMAAVINNWPQYGDFSHDYIFRPFFYLVIFLLWVWWVERLRRKA